MSALSRRAFLASSAAALAAQKSKSTKPNIIIFEVDELRATALKLTSLRESRLIRDSNGDVEFYDLKKDPLEAENAHGRPEYRGLEEELGKLVDS